MKANTKKMIKLSLVLYGVLLCVVLVSSLAWFVFDRTAGIESSDDMTITAGDNLQISLDGRNWDQLQVLSKVQHCPDITGDGIQFYFPSVLDDRDEVLFDDVSTFLPVHEQANKDRYYIDVDLYFRTTADTCIYLEASSYVRGKDTQTLDAMGGMAPNDLIAGAARVAFYEVDDTGAESLKSIWIPNDQYAIELDANGQITGFATENGTPETYKYLAPSAAGTSFEEKTWTTAQYASGFVSVGKDNLALAAAKSGETTVPPQINSALPLLDFSGNSQMTEKHMRIRIWIEGTDREAHTFLNSGEIEYKFHFISIQKSLPEAAEQAAFDGIKLESGKLVYADGTDVPVNKVKYSYDGIRWLMYNNTGAALDADKTVYIKMYETAATHPGTDANGNIYRTLNP